MRRNLVAFALAAVAALGVLGVQPAPVAAAQGYEESATTVYRLDPAKGVVRVTVALTFTNRTPDGHDPYACTENTFDWWKGWGPRQSTCYRTVRYFFSSTRVWVEKGATSIRATSNGKPLKAKAGAKGDRYRPVTVSFPNLFEGETRAIRVTYLVKGGAPRTPSTVRAMRAYASFCTVANGADSARVSVRVPGGFTIATTGSTMSVRTAGKERIYSSGTIADPAGFWACFDGTNESGYRTQKLTAAGGRDVTLKSWPEDPSWARGVRGELASGLPELVKLIGRPLPESAPLVIKEATTGSAYAGFYDQETGTITVDEDFRQPSLVQHELAHVWFNGASFGETWLNEGQAEWAARTVSGDEAACKRPAGGGSGISLATWQYLSPRATQRERQAVQAQYDAACYVVTRIARASGAERMTSAISALLERRDPYAADPTARRRTAVATWQDWLDAVDELALAPAGAQADLASNLLVEFGATADRATLARRTAARTAYHALVSAIDDWVVPDAVRHPLAAWEFDQAATAVAAASRAWAVTAETDEVLPGVDARHGPVADAWAAAETVEDLDAAASLARTQLEAARDVAEATAMLGQPLDFVQQVGLVGAQPPSLDAAIDAVHNADTDAAARAIASVRATIGGLRDSGRTRIAAAIAALVAMLSVVILVAVGRVHAGSRRRRTAHAGAGRGGSGGESGGSGPSGAGRGNHGGDRAGGRGRLGRGRRRQGGPDGRRLTDAGLDGPVRPTAPRRADPGAAPAWSRRDLGRPISSRAGAPAFRASTPPPSGRITILCEHAGVPDGAWPPASQPVVR